jgi:hypothetical protein
MAGEIEHPLEPDLHHQSHQHGHGHAALHRTALYRSSGGLLTAAPDHRFDGPQTWRKHHR